jgi:hypothetical protein
VSAGPGEGQPRALTWGYPDALPGLARRRWHRRPTGRGGVSPTQKVCAALLFRGGPSTNMMSKQLTERCRTQGCCMSSGQWTPRRRLGVRPDPRCASEPKASSPTRARTGKGVWLRTGRSYTTGGANIAARSRRLRGARLSEARPRSSDAQDPLADTGLTLSVPHAALCRMAGAWGNPVKGQCYADRSCAAHAARWQAARRCLGAAPRSRSELTRLITAPGGRVAP